MSVSVQCYVERKLSTGGEWNLAIPRCIHSDLKYILNEDIKEFDINNFTRYSRSEISTDLKNLLCGNNAEDATDYAYYYSMSLDEMQKNLLAVQQLINSNATTTCKAMGVTLELENNDIVDFDTDVVACIPISKVAVSECIREMLKLYKLGQIRMLMDIGDNYSTETSPEGLWLNYDVRFIFVMS